MKGTALSQTEPLGETLAALLFSKYGIIKTMAYKFKIFLFACAFLILISGINSLSNAQTTPDTQPPSVPSGLTATVVTPSIVQLSWATSTDNIGVVGYYIYRNGVQIVNIGSTFYLDTGLTPGGYTYNAAAYDAVGNVSPKSPPVTILLTLDTTPPSTPANFLATPNSYSTNSSSSTINISWTASTDNVGVVGYSLYRNNSLLATLTATSTLYTDYVPLGTYVYRLSAFDGSGNVSQSAYSQNLNIISDAIPPTMPNNFVAAVFSSNQINLSWTASTDNIGMAGYYISRNGSQIAAISSSSVSYADKSVTPGYSTYTISAYDSAGNLSQPAYVNATSVQDTTPPSVPIGLSGVLTPAGVNLYWSSSWDNLMLVGYYLYKNDAQIANTTSTSYLDTSVTPGTYTYSVAAYDSSNNVSASSSPVIITFTSFPVSQAATSTTTQTSSTPTTVGTSTNTTTSSTATPTAVTPSYNGPFNSPLAIGSRNAQVKILQSFLNNNGYLGFSAITGFFGKLTEQAVKKFQCDQNIACSGAVAWGFVGVKTRGVLNGLYNNSSSSTDISNPQTQSLQTQLLNLQAQLRALQSQIKP